MRRYRDNSKKDNKPKVNIENKDKTSENNAQTKTGQETALFRFKKLIKLYIILLVAGLIYGYILIPLGIHIRCPIHYFFGINCAFCGLTRICLSILHLNFDVLHYNYAIPIIVILGGILVLNLSTRYIFKEELISSSKLNTIIITALITWTILRNIIGV